MAERDIGNADATGVRRAAPQLYLAREMQSDRNRLAVDLNADLGESFGRYRLGCDEDLISYVTSVNIACGYHAGDAATMRHSVRLAREYGVGVGAHIAYPDLAGFGRRRMELSEDEVRDISVHQIASLLGFCIVEGVRLQHVKPHGQLYLTALNHRPTARAIAEAVASIDPDLLLLMYGNLVAEECARAGIGMVHEAYVDLDYAPDGLLILERAKRPRDPAQMARRAVEAVRGQGCPAIDDTWLALPVESICVHGDGPNAPQIAKAMRAALTDAGIEITELGRLARVGRG